MAQRNQRVEDLANRPTLKFIELVVGIMGTASAKVKSLEHDLSRERLAKVKDSMTYFERTIKGYNEKFLDDERKHKPMIDITYDITI